MQVISVQCSRHSIATADGCLVKCQSTLRHICCSNVRITCLLCLITSVTCLLRTLAQATTEELWNEFVDKIDEHWREVVDCNVERLFTIHSWFLNLKFMKCLWSQDVLTFRWTVIWIRLLTRRSFNVGSRRIHYFVWGKSMGKTEAG